MTIPQPRQEPSPGGRSGDGPGLVVVGVDGSREAWRAFWWAIGHARRARCPVLAVFVATSTFVTSMITYGDRDGRIAEALGALAAELSQQVVAAGADVGVDVQFTHVRGDPANALLHVARERAADLIVVGAPGHLVHRLIGSHTASLIRRREIPVVVVP
ncbi:MAG TPA: universal stress protein [Micromonosporaceae bacterium]|nr:universal stress protein [Micromonosporaceae bacterium]